jgi:Uma2 family endonuclease
MSTLDHLSDLAPERVRPLKRVEFETLVSLGLLGDERVELLGGVIVEMSPQNPRHAAAIQRLTQTLTRIVGDRAGVRIQLPFVASDDSLPEPDVALVPPGDYAAAHPASALLLVEVAAASLRKDRLLKAELYARAGVPEYWIVNLAEGCVEAYSKPVGGVYTQVSTADRTASLPIAALPGAEINLRDILG